MYQHKTCNELMFDRIRSIQDECDLVSSYLKREEESRYGGAGLQTIILNLDKASTIIFDDVYKALRQKWEQATA